MTYIMSSMFDLALITRARRLIPFLVASMALLVEPSVAQETPDSDDVIYTGEHGHPKVEPATPAPSPTPRSPSRSGALKTAGLGLATYAGLLAGFPLASMLVKSLNLLARGPHLPLLVGFATVVGAALAANAIYQGFVDGEVNPKKMLTTTAGVAIGSLMGGKLGPAAGQIGALLGGQAGSFASR